MFQIGDRVRVVDITNYYNDAPLAPMNPNGGPPAERGPDVVGATGTIRDMGGGNLGIKPEGLVEQMRQDPRYCACLIEFDRPTSRVQEPYRQIGFRAGWLLEKIEQGE